MYKRSFTVHFKQDFTIASFAAERMYKPKISTKDKVWP